MSCQSKLRQLPVRPLGTGGREAQCLWDWGACSLSFPGFPVFFKMESVRGLVESVEASSGNCIYVDSHPGLSKCNAHAHALYHDIYSMYMHMNT